MKCQHCNENDAVTTFVVVYSGGKQEVHLCEACTRKAQQYYETMRRVLPGIFREGDTPMGGRTAGRMEIPETAGFEFRRKREMNVLRARLAQAVENERYEEAARLRDQIAAAEKGVVSI